MLDDLVAALVAQQLVLDPHRRKGAQHEGRAHRLVHRLVERLALLGGEQAGDLARPRFDRVGQFGDQRRALVGRRRRPGGEGRLGRRDRLVQHRFVGLGAARERLPRGRIDDVERSRPRMGLAVDEQAELAVGHFATFVQAGCRVRQLSA